MRVVVRTNRNNRVHEDVVHAMEFQERDEQLNEILMRVGVHSILMIGKDGSSTMYSKVDDAPDELSEDYWAALMESTSPEDPAWLEAAVEHDRGVRDDD